MTGRNGLDKIRLSEAKRVKKFSPNRYKASSGFHNVVSDFWRVMKAQEDK